ncbi:MAG: hypothetical protein CMG00_09090 [Candidatus Marinimicrobia bacterium]|nr:hypothetical protein [Candidatus Neomarinimicrobiota bacterium]|tara:strand:- start:5324 stop:5920 length:597 start_codon:yes stop_codon:yes gene_type:complete
MKLVSKSDLIKIFDREIDLLIDGVTNISNPYHFFSLATLNKKKVTSRTVVLRRVDRNPLSIYFNADYRSPKIKQLLDKKYCSILFYDNKRKMQLRANCDASVNYKNHLTKEIWDNTPLQSRKCYMGKHKPSQQLEQWHPNVPLKYLKRDPEKSDSESGYNNFTVVHLFINQLDILELHHDGHIRFTLDSDKKLCFLAP